MELLKTFRFTCSGADLDLCAYSGVTVCDSETRVELTKLTQEQIESAVLSFVGRQGWRDRDSTRPDEFLDALIARVAEAQTERKNHRERQASA